MGFRARAESYSEPTPRRRSPLRHAALAFAALVSAPLVFEAALLALSRWRSLWGQVMTVRTPLLDALGAWLGGLFRSGRGLVHEPFLYLPWKAHIVIVLGIAWAAVGSLILRGRR